MMQTVETAPPAARLRGAPLACPRDRGLLEEVAEGLRCTRCGMTYPVVGGVPVLINDDNSAFAIADYTGGAGYSGASYGRAADRTGGLRRRLRAFFRRLGDVQSSIRHAGQNEALAHVRALHMTPRVLVIGSGGLRFGTPSDRVLHTDVAFGPAVDAIADAHDIPFADGSFDLVVAVAVLEHVADPQRCLAEIARVLTPGGHVYAVTPFLQPVHMGAYDFTRFTPIGHRRLFRAFDEIAAGVTMGAGSTLAGAITGALLAVSDNRTWRRIARLTGLLAGAPLRLADRFLRHGADAACGLWFFGRLREGPPVSDRELVRSYPRALGFGPRNLPPP